MTVATKDYMKPNKSGLNISTKIIAATVISLGSLFAQSPPLDETLRGPIPGLTARPQTGRILGKLELLSLSSDPVLGLIGTGRITDSRSSSTIMRATGVYALTPKLAVEVVVPMILSQWVKYSQFIGRSEVIGPHLLDLIPQSGRGKTGLADVIVGGQFTWRENDGHRIAFNLYYKLHNGTPVYRLEDDEYFPTGTGQSNLKMQLAIDLADPGAYPAMVHSAAISYTFQGKTDVSDSELFKPGNMVDVQLRVVLKSFSPYNVGFDVNFHKVFSGDAVSRDGQVFRGDEGKFLAFTPLLAYQRTWGTRVINIHSRFSFYLLSDYFPRTNTLYLGTDLYF